ncbi:MAG: endolytic transglycosylase MltG [Candidatus Pacebacteria bacterium]|nr:endolytic transglycosylase MltG [Candidatus Paceibacterota bacterium]
MDQNKKVFLGGIVSIVLFLFLAYFFYLSRPTGSKIDVFKIEKGDGVSIISKNLESSGAVRSRIAFEIWTILTGRAHKMKPGFYQIKEDSSMFKIVASFVDGPTDFKFLITEGKSMFDIEKQLINLGMLGGRELIGFDASNFYSDFDFLKGVSNLEGFIFPDTYNIAQASDLNSFIKLALDNFKEKALPLFDADGRLISYLHGITPSLYDILAMASIIEKEVPLQEDRLIVSGILWKRYILGMPLQVDASVIYAKCVDLFINKEDLKKCGSISRSDFSLKSEYNTYFVAGLPAGPIANPGKDAILAALNPKKSLYFYYLSSPKTKETIFSKDFDEHSINRAKYLGL